MSESPAADRPSDNTPPDPILPDDIDVEALLNEADRLSRDTADALAPPDPPGPPAAVFNADLADAGPTSAAVDDQLDQIDRLVGETLAGVGMLDAPPEPRDVVVPRDEPATPSPEAIAPPVNERIAAGSDGVAVADELSATAAPPAEAEVAARAEAGVPGESPASDAVPEADTQDENEPALTDIPAPDLPQTQSAPAEPVVAESAAAEPSLPAGPLAAAPPSAPASTGASAPQAPAAVEAAVASLDSAPQAESGVPAASPTEESPLPTESPAESPVGRQGLSLVTCAVLWLADRVLAALDRPFARVGRDTKRAVGIIAVVTFAMGIVARLVR